MRRLGTRFGWARLLGVAALAAVTTAGVWAQQGQKPGPGGAGAKWEWTAWGADASSSRYSPLDQINASNFSSMQVMWRWKAANFGPEPDFIYRATPIYVNNKLYAVAGIRRAVVCIEPTTGETVWTWREVDGGPRWEASTRKNYGKGVAFAVVDGKPIIYVATAGSFLYALDANTGQQIQAFGNKGQVDLHVGLGNYKLDPVRGAMDYGDVTTSSAPLVVNGVVLMGNSHDRGYYPENKENIPGIFRGYDAKTGKLLWRFDPVPKRGEPFHETWENESARYTGNVSPWAPLSADPALGLVYVPTDTPTNDYYGGHRLGMNVFGTSLIALDIKTGKRAWHFQFVHHDIWNYDTPDAPHLLDVNINGVRTPIVAQATKQGFLYVLNRKTGEPIWPIPEKAVPTDSDVPGEVPWPTQPHPTKPEPFELQGFSDDHLINFTPALKEEARKIAARHRQGPLFTPPMMGTGTNLGEGGAWVVPGANGGANIPGGAAVDPETGWVYVATQRGHSVIRMQPTKNRFPNAKPWPGWGGEAPTSNFVATGPGGVAGPSGGQGNPPLPILRPPYGSIVAYDLNAGDRMWSIPNGETPARIRNHPALKGIDVGNTGQNSHANLLVTKSLLMYGEGRGGDAFFRAVDKKTGKELVKFAIPAQTNTAPMTFMHNGHQYIVMAVASATVEAELVALALPAAKPARLSMGTGN